MKLDLRRVYPHPGGATHIRTHAGVNRFAFGAAKDAPHLDLLGLNVLFAPAMARPNMVHVCAHLLIMDTVQSSAISCSISSLVSRVPGRYAVLFVTLVTR